VQTLQQQGFSNITVLEHGKTTLIHDRLAITATIGAPIGPFTRENGYIISDQSSGESLYYEPHGYPDPRLSQLAPIRTAIIPIVDLKIPLLGTIINGQNSALTIAQTLQAKHLIPTALGGDLEFTGIITKALQVAGSPAQLQKQLTERQMDTIILEPRSWETFRLPC
jgi:L-ascorbate metabolism protein UlaG (beta-lactamase superfamily)